MNSDLSFFKKSKYFELLEEFATRDELRQLQNSKNFDEDLVKLASTFIKRKNWFKWRNYFKKYANLKDKEKLQKMVNEKQIDRAYFFMQQKFASSIESLTSYAQGAIVAKILSYLQISDLVKIAKISTSLSLIIDKYHLIERRKNMGILVEKFFDGFGVTKFCHYSNMMFVSVHNNHELRVYEWGYNYWMLTFTKKFENEITHIRCLKMLFGQVVETIVVAVDADNNVYFFKPGSVKEFQSFSISKNENILDVSISPGNFFIATNLNVYSVYYEYSSKLPIIEKNNIILNSQICSNIVYFNTRLIYFAGNNLYYNGDTQKIPGLEGSILDYWLDLNFFFVKTDISIFYLRFSYFQNVKDTLPDNYNFNPLNIKKITFDIDGEKLNIFILSNNGILESLNDYDKKIIVQRKNVIDTNFTRDDKYMVYVTWKDDDPKWPVIASPCVSCGIQSADMFGCGNKCSAVYCSKQCAADDWSTNHSNKCK